MSLLTRYVTWRFGVNFALTLLVLTLLAIAFELMDQAERVLNATDGSGLALLRFAGLRLADKTAQMLPFAALIATLVTMGLLIRYSELIAMWGGGRSAFGVLLSFLPAGLLISALQFVLDDQAVPRSYETLRDWNVGKFAAKARAAADETAIWLLSDDDIVRLSTVDGLPSNLGPITIFERDHAGRLTGQIVADDAEAWNGAWRLRNARIIDATTAAVTPQPALVWTGVIELDVLPLLARTFPELMLVDIRRLLAREGLGQRPVDPLRTWFNGRLAAVLHPLLMVALVVSLAQVNPRSGGFGGIVLIAIAIAFAYMVFDRATFAMGEAGLLPPLLAAWSGKAVLMATIAALYLRHERA